MFQYIYRILIIICLAFVMYFAHSAYLYFPKKKSNWKKELILAGVFIALLLLTSYVRKLI